MRRHVRMTNVFLICFTLAALQGCMVTHTMARNMAEDAQVVSVNQAVVEGDWLVVEFSIAPKENAKSPSSLANRCGKFYMTWDRFIQAAMTDEVVKRKSSQNIAIPRFVGMDSKAVYLGELNDLGCTTTLMKRKASPENQVPVINSKSSLNHDNTPVKYVYFTESMINAFYYIDKTKDTGLARVVQLRVSDQKYVPRYSPVLFVMMPVAVVIDVVTFPIQAIICGEVSKQYCPISP